MGDESPKNKVKFLCSYGGKVLPRPSDGLLRYVGGETRVVSLPRDINFSELMKKTSSMVEGDMVLKYQLVPEDLDTLVSVRTDEDVKHVIEEHDRHHTGLLRAFLFPPSKPGLIASEPYPLEQRYIDAINGIIRTSPRSARGSACCSPKSMSPDAGDYSPSFRNMNMNMNMNVNAMQRVRSSPSLTNLDHMTHHHHQQHQHHRPPQDPQMGGRGGVGVRGGNGNGNGNGNGTLNYYYTNNTRSRGGGGGGYAYQDDSYGHVPISVPRSPRTKTILWE